MYNNYSKMSALRTTELQVIRKGFWKPVYVLTDGQFEYGQLSCDDAWGRQKSIETANGTWRIKPIGFWGKQTQIIDATRAEVVGQIITQSGWCTKNRIELNNGFSAILKKGPGFFSREINWTNDQNIDIIKITCTSKLKMPFKIQVDQSFLQTDNPLALIVLIGVNLVLIRQAQAAAIA